MSFHCIENKWYFISKLRTELAHSLDLPEATQKQWGFMSSIAALPISHYTARLSYSSLLYSSHRVNFKGFQSFHCSVDPITLYQKKCENYTGRIVIIRSKNARITRIRKYSLSLESDRLTSMRRCREPCSLHFFLAVHYWREIVENEESRVGLNSPSFR